MAATIPKYLIKSQLSEKQIEADVSNFLGWSLPGGAHAPLRLLDVDEQATGADKRLDIAVPIFIQFKKSDGLHPISKIKNKKSRNPGALERIRQYRQSKGLDDNPTLFFGLRARAKGASDFQHNILLSYNDPPRRHAIYVAPLHLDKDEYSKVLFDSSLRYDGNPFSRFIDWDIYPRDLGSFIRTVPYMRAHVSISPHEIVSTHKHHYAFSQVGSEITWHSPSYIGSDVSRLSDFMSVAINYLVNKPRGFNTVENALKDVTEVALRHSKITEMTFSGDGPLEKLQAHGKWLLETFEIRQILLLANSRFLEQIQG